MYNNLKSLCQVRRWSLPNAVPRIIDDTSAIAKGVDKELMVDEINKLNSAKKDLEQRIAESKAITLPPIEEEHVREALLKFKEYVKANNSIECLNFIKSYIHKIEIFKDLVEVTFIVASAIFNAMLPR